MIGVRIYDDVFSPRVMRICETGGAIEERFFYIVVRTV